MRQLITTLALAAIVLSSCNKNKTYKYIEIVSEESIIGGRSTKEKSPKEIKAINDSAAYLAAYESFCIAKKVNKDMEVSLGKVYSIPLQFKLLNDKGDDITSTVSFHDKAKKEKQIEEEIFSMKNSVQESLENRKKEDADIFKQTAKIDSVKIRELSKFFRQKKGRVFNQ